MWPAAETTQVGLAEPTSPTSPTAPVGGAGAAGGASGGGDSFANVLGNAIDSLSATQTNADNLATQAATGGLTNVADYMVAANEANIQTQLTSAVRNSALQSFQADHGDAAVTAPVRPSRPAVRPWQLEHCSCACASKPPT